MVSLGELGEAALIARFARAGAPPGADLWVPNGDDAAVIAGDPEAGDAGVVLTTDSLVEGVHFDLAWTHPEEVGRKLIATSLSDLAAMGARPSHALLSLHLDPALDIALIDGLAAGVHARAAAHGVAVVGGNLTRTRGPMVLAAVLVGRGRRAALVGRGRAEPGDELWVSGRLGDAAAGLERARAGRDASAPLPFVADGGAADSTEALLRALVDPVPRVEAGPALCATGLLRALCDVSDGLARDLPRLLQGSGRGACIELGALPLSPALVAHAGPRAAGLALIGGEDYELLCVARPGSGPALCAAVGPGLRLSRIGVVTEAPSLLVQGGPESGPPVPLGDGFDHFLGG